MTIVRILRVCIIDPRIRPKETRAQTNMNSKSQQSPLTFVPNLTFKIPHISPMSFPLAL